MIRAAFLRSNDLLYTRLLRPVIFYTSAETAHTRLMRLLRILDSQPGLSAPLGWMRQLASNGAPVTAGGVTLDVPLILGAGVVKGDGFESEDAALAAVQAGRNIMPGWRSLPRWVGPVEFGSFTRWPRLGNPGVVLWRDEPTRSTQNRVGLRNPGAHAAAEFLAARRADLPAQYGINIAISPGVDDPDQQTDEVLAALAAFIERGVRPTWFTLNLSCPNTEDDPTGNQTADQARQLCGAAVGYLQDAGVGQVSPGRGGFANPPLQARGPDVVVPLWVKIGPNLSVEQYCHLMRVFDETGARAVVATNTLPTPSPADPTVMAGMGGGRLHDLAVKTVARLMQEKAAQGYAVDIIGCGGVIDGMTYRDFANLGVRVVQYWSAIVYRGPLAAALIAHEAQQ
jgi:dihydroorotate dehydrogenase